MIMKLDLVKKLINMLPDGPKKEELLARLKQVEREKGGLHDIFEFAPKGHIKIEKIDSEGNVVGVLADQPNMVVKGAEEILLRAFSGDPDRVLYKIRVPKKDSTGALISPKYHVALPAGVSTLFTGDQLNVPPNHVWKAVNDADFDIYYSYRPRTLYLKDDVSDQVGKVAFKIYATPVTGSVPISSELYSTATNMFIGLGDGKNYTVPFTDPRLTISTGFVDDGGARTATTVGETITFKQKISNFVLSYQKSNTGGQITVSINGVPQPVIETLDSSLVTPVVESKTYSGLSLDTETTVEIKFSGADASVASPKVTITEIRFDALDPNMTSMIHEFENFTKVFDTVTSYSTSNVPDPVTGKYFFQLNNYPVDPASVSIDYNNTTLTQVDSIDKVTEGKYFVDAVHGKVYFSRTLSNLLVKYNITGEIYALKAASALTPTTVTRTITGEVPAGAIDGTNKVFQLSEANLVSGTEVVKKTSGGVTTTLVKGTDYTIDYTKGTITFIDTKQPKAGDTLTVDYQSKSNARQFIADFEIDPSKGDTVKIKDYATGKTLTMVTDPNQFKRGTFMLDTTGANKKLITISDRTADAPDLTPNIANYEILYTSYQKPGFPTQYTRAVIEKPKAGIAYPWYQLDKGTVSFVAEFPEGVPAYDVTIREMGLFNGPRKDDNIEGFDNTPVDAFSLVRIGETRKEVSTGIRVTWTITLLNKDGQPFTGGF
jgi:hypothetical protein